LRSIRLCLLIVTAALLSAATWADGIDPKVGIQGGGGSQHITPLNPNLNFKGTTGTTGCSIPNNVCLVLDFENDLGHAINSLTIFIQDNPKQLPNATYECADGSSFGLHCADPVHISGGWDIVFSGGLIPSACVSDNSPLAALDPVLWSLPGSCKVWDKDDYVGGGEFALDIESVNGDLPAGVVLQGTVITPEPSSLLMLVFGLLAFGLFQVVGRCPGR
jgi:hypothetical protein